MHRSENVNIWQRGAAVGNAEVVDPVHPQPSVDDDTAVLELKHLVGVACVPVRDRVGLDVLETSVLVVGPVSAGAGLIVVWSDSEFR